MPKAILYVESHPVSPEREDEYNDWYDGTHLPEVVALPNFVSGRRFKPAKPGEPYVAIYEVEADDLSAVMTTLGEAVSSGKLQMSDAIQMDPRPTIRLLEVMTEHSPASARA